MTAASPYFERALKTTFKEGQNSRVELEEEDPATFGFLNEYLHQGYIEHQDPSIQGSKGASPLMAEWGSLWLLAHYLQIQRLMNYCMWRLLTLDTQGVIFPLQDIERLYGVTFLRDEVQVLVATHFWVMKQPKNGSLPLYTTQYEHD